jgi:hypothetical protein
MTEGTVPDPLLEYCGKGHSDMTGMLVVRSVAHLESMTGRGPHHFKEVLLMGIRILVNIGIAAALAVSFAACGSGGGSSPTAPSANDGPIAATIVIDATGNVTPKDVTVPVGSRVTFTNNHNALHQDRIRPASRTHAVSIAEYRGISQPRREPDQQ